MKFKELRNSDKKYIYSIYSNNSLSWDYRMLAIINKYNISERTVRRWIKKLGYSFYNDQDSDHLAKAKARVYDTSKKYHIITWAQNATPVHTEFLKNLLAYKNFLDAELHIIAGRYKNPTSVFSDKDQDWWDNSVVEYISVLRHNIHPYVSILGDIKVQPTALEPLSGFEGITGDSTSILGHPSTHFRSLPVLEGTPHKFLATTGAVTIPNYTDSKVGKRSEFHHTYGCIIIELKNKDTFFIRQISATPDGAFYDLHNHVINGGVSSINKIPCYVFGDIHAAHMDHGVFNETIKLFDRLTPEHVILHDVLDGDSVNHHERKNPIKVYQRIITGRHLVKKEIDTTLAVIDALLDYKPVIVSSNHNDWLDRWIVDQDWKKDVENSLIYMELTQALLSDPNSKGALPYLIKKKFQDQVLCLGRDESFKILGWELANHGDKGTHGSKGNLTQYSKLSTKVIVGDYHQPGRKLGVMSVGTYSKLRLGYNVGPSAWANSGAIIHPNGKAQLIIFTDRKKFTTLENVKS